MTFDFQQVHFAACKYVENCWMSGKQCRPWSDAAFLMLAYTVAQARLPEHVEYVQ